jgi:hypothetical protein
MPLESPPAVIAPTDRARKAFARRLFPPVDLAEAPLDTWEHTFDQMQKSNIPEKFYLSIFEFIAFVNNPSEASFEEWKGTLGGALEDDNVMDDWNTSWLFMATLMTKYRDLEGVTDGAAIVPLDNVTDVRDCDFDAWNNGNAVPVRAFATVVLGIAALHDPDNETENPMADVAEKLLEKAERLQDETDRRDSFSEEGEEGEEGEER